MSMTVSADDPAYGLTAAIVSYVVIFGAFFGYLVHLHLGQRRLRKRLDALARRVPPQA